MKKRWTLFMLGIVFFIPLVLASQTEGDAVIRGVVPHTKDSRISINKQDVLLDDENKFEQTIPLEKPEYIEIGYGKDIAIYVKPGYEMDLHIDADQPIGSIKVSGDGSDINAFLIDQAEVSAKLNAYFDEHFRELFVLDEEAYTRKMNELWQPFHNAFNGFQIRKTTLDVYFVKTYEAMMLYSWANVMVRYPNWYRQFSGNSDYVPSDDFFSFLSRLNMNDPELLELDEYQKVLENYLGYRADELAGSPEFHFPNYKSFRAKMKAALDIFTDPLVRSDMLYSFMKKFVTEYNHKDGEDLIHTFKENCTRSDYIKDIEKSIRYDQNIQSQCDVRVYKQIGSITLDVFLYFPTDWKKGDKRPVLAFFHGGGWECGKPEWGHTQCRHFSQLGMVGASFQYRLTGQHGSNPVVSVSDAKSAIRWLREHAGELGIDPDRIAASGYSAGGHLAACTVMIQGFDDADDNLSVSPAANANIYWVPALKIFEDGWFKNLLGGRAAVKDIDPFSQIRPGLPPCIIFQGTEDDTVPLWTVEAFTEKTRTAGNRCDLHVYKGQTHLGWSKNEADVLEKMDRFLESLGYIDVLQDHPQNNE
jgi:acetyl esterase